jgi:hypothetical protein
MVPGVGPTVGESCSKPVLTGASQEVISKIESKRDIARDMIRGYLPMRFRKGTRVPRKTGNPP